MKSYQSFFNEYEYYITPSDIIEFMYCPRFTYYMKCLGISQYEEKRFKVQKGRETHEAKELQNVEYLRKKIGVVNKLISGKLYSTTFKLRGIVDEILELEDHTYAPLDYKFAIFDEKLYSTYKSQLILYAIMIEEMYQVKVNKGYLVYVRSKNLLKQIDIIEKDKEQVMDTLSEYTKVLMGYYPRKTNVQARCLDCCYKNICIK